MHYTYVACWLSAYTFDLKKDVRNVPVSGFIPGKKFLQKFLDSSNEINYDQFTISMEDNDLIKIEVLIINVQQDLD